MAGPNTLSRTAAQLQALQARTALSRVEAQVAERRERLSTGKRIERAEDDPADYAVAKKLGARTRSRAQALANAGDAKSMLAVAEGGLQSAMAILQEMREKTLQAASDSMSAGGRADVKRELDAYVAELDDLFTGTEFNGTPLFDEAGTRFSFQTGEAAGDTLDVSIAPLSARPLFNYSESSTPVDVVFVMDNSGSMGDEQAAVAANVRAFVDGLTTRGADVALGLTRFGQNADNGAPVVEDGGVLTQDTDYFINDVWSRNVEDGGNEPAYQALIDSAGRFQFRDGSRRLFIQITDEPSLDGNEMARELVAANTVDAVGGVFHGIVSSSSQGNNQDVTGDYDDIARVTGGSLHDIGGDISTILTSIVDTVDVEVSGDLDVSSHDAAIRTLGRVDHALGIINGEVATLGEAQRRLTNTQDELDAAHVVDEGARSRLEDADFAKEAMELARLQMLQQAGLASLAQANVPTEAVLSLMG